MISEGHEPTEMDKAVPAEELRALDRLLTGVGQELAHRIERRRRVRSLVASSVLFGAAAIVATVIMRPSDNQPSGAQNDPVEVGMDVESSRPFVVVPASRCEQRT